MKDTLVPADVAVEDALLEVRDLSVRFPVVRGPLRRAAGFVHAVESVSFDIARGEALGLVGESGAGKSTVGRAVLRLVEPACGSVRYRRERGGAALDLSELRARELRALRRELQIVFQDPASSLDPRCSVAEIVGEGPRAHGLAQGPELARLVERELDRVRLPRDLLQRHPHEMSGGERQRVAIARALALSPRLLVCDEIASALDVSVQAQLAELLAELRRELGLTYLFISHDLRLVREVAGRVAVMYLGRVVESGPAEAVLEHPAHPYTQALVSAVPRVDASERRQRVLLRGEQPSSLAPPPGCVFHTRCPVAEARCRTEVPAMVDVSDATGAHVGHRAACLLLDGSSAQTSRP